MNELVVISQNGCAPCHEVKMLLNSEGIEYREVNISLDPDAIEEYHVMSAPVVILMEDGEEVTRVNGSNDQDQILELAENL